MITQDEVDLSNIVTLVADYMSAAAAADMLARQPASRGVQPGETDQLQRLEFVSRVLEHWGETAAATAVAVLERDLSGLSAAWQIGAKDRFLWLLQRVLQVNNQIQALSPLATRPEQVCWPQVSSDKPTGLVQQPGYLLVFWSRRRSDLGTGAAVWRLLRRELHTAEAVRLRPYKSNAAVKQAQAMRVAVRVLVGLPDGPAPAPRRDGGRTQLRKVQHFIEPGSGGGLAFGDQPWCPSDERQDGGEERSAIGYFFVPGRAAGTPGPGLDHEELLGLLMRTLWGLCPMVPTAQRRNQLAFRLFAAPASIAWQTGGPPGRLGDDGNTGWHLFDQAATLPIVPEIFRDSATMNCAVVHPNLLDGGGTLAQWFRPTWRVPFSHHREYDHLSPEWLASSPMFDGRPGWVERVDHSTTEPIVTEVFPKGREFPRRPVRPTPFHRRRSARVAPARPLTCWLALPDGQPPLRAYIVDYGFSGCRVHVPLPDDTGALLPRLERLKEQDTSATLRVASGLTAPWPYPGSRDPNLLVRVVLPLPPEDEEDTRVESTCNAVLGGPVVQIRFLLGPLVDSRPPTSPRGAA